MTEVFVGKLNLSSSGKLTIELETPFKYTGNNLFVEFDLPVVESNTYKSANFIGTEENYMPSRQAQAYTYTEDGTAYNFLPKIVIDYAEGNVCLPATNVHASDWGSSIIVNWDAPAINKNKNVILNENFENGIPSDWTQIDADGDGNIWTQIETFEGHNGGLCISSASYIDNVGPVYPDNYLITPLVKGATSISYRVSVQDIYYPNERYAVMVSSTGTAASDFTTVFEEKMAGKGNLSENERGARIQGTWYERNIELPAGIKYVAFRHYNSSDEYWLNLDDITIYGGGAEESFTYSLSRNGTEIATGLILTNYTDEGLDVGTYEYCVEVVYEDCISEPACSAPVEIIVVGPIVIPPVTNLTADVDGNVVTLNWDKPIGKYVEVILEAHDVWGDGTGFQLLLDADAVEYGQTIPISGPLWDDCSAPTTLYDVFEY